MSKKTRMRNWSLFLIFNIFMCFAIDLLADDWPQWRGSNRDGISKETGLIKAWSEKGPQILWRMAVGDGFSAISVVDGRIYTMWTEEDGEYLFCLDAVTGNKLWQYRVGPIFYDSWANGPRSTPTVDNDIVYVTGANGYLHAVQATNGKSVWSHNLVQEYGTNIPHWGYSCSPLIDNNLVVTDVGGKENHRRQIIFFNENGLHSLSPENGNLLWEYEWKRTINIATPVFIAPDKIFISCSYEKSH